MTTREIKTVTIKLNDTAPGGFAGMDANNQIIPNGADPVSAQDLATRAYADSVANVPTNTKYVRVPADFGPIINISGNNYHSLPVLFTQYIILNDLVMTDGLAVTGGAQIKSANREQAKFDWQGFTGAPPVITTAAGRVIFDSITFTNTAATTSVLIDSSSGSPTSAVQVRNCVFDDFDNVFLSNGIRNTTFEDNVGTGIGGIGVELNNVAQTIVHNNTLTLTGGSAKAINITGTSLSNSRISDNTCTNVSSFFVDVNNTIPAALSGIAFTGNKVSNPANFFDPSGLDQTSVAVYCSGNLEVVNSKAFMSATDTNSVANTITINTQNIPEEVTGRVIQANSVNRFFNVTSVGVPTVPKVEYVGASPHYFTATIRCGLASMAGTDSISLGLFINGVANNFTFMPTPISTTGHVYVSSSIILLAPGDLVTFAVRNNSDSSDINLSSLGIALSQIT